MVESDGKVSKLKVKSLGFSEKVSSQQTMQGLKHWDLIGQCLQTVEETVPLNQIALLEDKGNPSSTKQYVLQNLQNS